jgi:hypothetical protein
MPHGSNIQRLLKRPTPTAMTHQLHKSASYMHVALRCMLSEQCRLVSCGLFRVLGAGWHHSVRAALRVTARCSPTSTVIASTVKHLTQISCAPALTLFIGWRHSVRAALRVTARCSAATMAGASTAKANAQRSHRCVHPHQKSVHSVVRYRVWQVLLETALVQASKTYVSI